MTDDESTVSLCWKCQVKTRHKITEGRSGALERCAVCKNVLRVARPASVTVHDLTANEVRLVELRMRPGAVSQAGFLDPTESLVAVTRSDDTTLRALGVTHSQVASRIQRLIGKAKATVERQVKLQEPGTAEIRRIIAAYNMLGEDPRSDSEKRGPGIRVDEFEVWSHLYNGWQGCPFFLDGDVGRLSTADTCGDSDRDWIVRNTVLNDEIFFSELIIHLLRHHQFCEGHTEYRLDPARTVRVLRIGEVEGSHQ